MICADSVDMRHGIWNTKKIDPFIMEMIASHLFCVSFFGEFSNSTMAWPNQSDRKKAATTKLRVKIMQFHNIIKHLMKSTWKWARSARCSPHSLTNRDHYTVLVGEWRYWNACKSNWERKNWKISNEIATDNGGDAGDNDKRRHATAHSN